MTHCKSRCYLDWEDNLGFKVKIGEKFKVNPLLIVNADAYKGVKYLDNQGNYEETNDHNYKFNFGAGASYYLT